MKNLIILVTVLVLMFSFMVGCGKATSPTAPIATTAIISTATATATETSTTDPTLSTSTATETSVVPGASATATFNPVVNLQITTTNTILVIVKKSSETVGTLVFSNNPAFLIGYTSGDIIEISAQDQTSQEIITVVASWDGASFPGRTSIPNGVANFVELPPLP